MIETGGRRTRAGGALLLSAGLLLPTQSACLSDPADVPQGSGQALLAARPGEASEPLAPGRHPLSLGSGRDGFLYVPAGYEAGTPAPLMILLHGAGGRADNWLGAFAIADSLGVVLVAPDSRGQTWDVVRGVFGVDVSFIDQALEKTFRHCDIDPASVAMAGFSDGASYALSLGLSNGDLVTHVVAWSPGFMRPADPQGDPLIFVSHGTSDGILPISSTSRRIVPDLQASGYSVAYEEFEGGHELPREIAERAFGWFLDGQ